MGIKLVKLEPKYKRHLTEMMDEWLSVETFTSPYVLIKNDYHDFDYYLHNLEVKNPTANLVPDSVYFALDEDRDIFLGAINIRHYLNDGLLETGGHIGDGVRPSERRRGVATEMIRQALIICKEELHIDRVLITCNRDNIGSAKSIINNGGVLENEVLDDGKPLQRYWINL